MVEQCEDSGLDVVQGDVIDLLQDFPADSLSAVTAFHLIEHLHLDLLVKVDETVRALKPGGIAIFETPNPENVLVGAYTFYFDPTHQKPLPALMVKFLAEARGLCQVETKYLNPSGEEFYFKENGSEVAKWVKDFFYGPRDYAMIGYKL